MKTILHAVAIKALPNAVYRALTTADGLAGWWTTRVELDPRPPGRIRFFFNDQFGVLMEQVKLVPDRSVEWKCVGGHDNWADNTFIFRLEERSGATKLLFTQEYAQELDDETYGNYNFNWGYYLNSLKQRCETGKGDPFTTPAS